MSEVEAVRAWGWNDRLPETVSVVETTPEGHATRLYAVRLDYGWAERIVCDRCYDHDAHALALSISALTGASYEPMAVAA